MADAELSGPEHGVYREGINAQEKWMVAGGETGKQAFAPWGGRDHPDVDPHWNWGWRPTPPTARLSPSGGKCPRTLPGEEQNSGWGLCDSSYRGSESEESPHLSPDGNVFDDKAGGEFGVLSLFAAEKGIISKPWDRLAGKEWWDAVEAAREYVDTLAAEW